MELTTAVAVSMAAASSAIAAGLAYRQFMKPFESMGGSASDASSPVEDTIADRLQMRYGYLLFDDDDDLRLKLDRAGLSLSPVAWKLECAGVALMGLALGLIATMACNAIVFVPLGMVAGLTAGVLTPRLWLQSATKTFRKKIERSLPGALELMCVLVGAGLPLERVLREVSKQEAAVGVFASQLARAMAEVDAGAPVEDALGHVALRCDSPMVSSLVSSLCLSQKQGTSISHALDAQAKEARNAWFESVRESVGRAEVLIQLPLCLCFVPAILVTTMAPMLSSLVTQLAGFGGLSFGLLGGL